MRHVEIASHPVSVIGMGCMGLSEGYGQVDDARAVRAIRSALDNGITLFDTADIYGADGHNERLLNRVLGADRAKVTISTKFGLVRTGPGFERKIYAHPSYVRTACEQSLSRLGVEALDIYFLHRMDRDVPIEDTVGAMADLVKAGLVKSIGLCEISEATLRSAAQVHPIAAIQCEYSLWTRDPEQNGILKACAALGTQFIAYSPLGRGFLGGAVKSAPSGSDDFRTTMPRFLSENLPHNLRLLQGLQKIADRHNCTTAQLALAWLLSRPENIVVIPGIDRESFVTENVRAAEIPLSKETMEEIEQAFPAEEVKGDRYATNFSKWTNM
jgi:aryl-alcohol dehydrogenase-like predicted oxidoreductase